MILGPYIVADNLKPWMWERVDEEGCIPESSLMGPRVLCRHWHRGDENFDASLIANALVMLKLLVDIQTARKNLGDYNGFSPGLDERIDAVISTIMTEQVEYTNEYVPPGVKTGRFQSSKPNYSHVLRDNSIEDC